MASATNKAFGLVGTSMGLIALYLVLTNNYGATKILGAAGKFYVDAVRVLQGR